MKQHDGNGIRVLGRLMDAVKSQAVNTDVIVMPLVQLGTRFFPVVFEPCLHHGLDSRTRCAIAPVPDVLELVGPTHVLKLVHQSLAFFSRDTRDFKGFSHDKQRSKSKRKKKRRREEEEQEADGSEIRSKKKRSQFIFLTNIFLTKYNVSQPLCRCARHFHGRKPSLCFTVYSTWLYGVQVFLIAHRSDGPTGMLSQQATHSLVYLDICTSTYLTNTSSSS